MGVEASTTDDVYVLPDDKALESIGECSILDESGNSLLFKSLWQNGEKGRVLIVFIRHFYCGLCEAYVEELTSKLPQSMLDTLSPPVKLLIVGCGTPAPVVEYRRRTNCGFPIYCDPDRKLYSQLDMVENLGMGTHKPEYLKQNMFLSTLNSAYNAVTAGRNVMKAGHFAQNGGELLFEGGVLRWIHRMRNTRDHAEVTELKDVLHI